MANTVTLTGSAVLGIDPHLTLAAAKPTEVKLGAILRPAPAMALSLKNYFSPYMISAGQLPDSLNRRGKAAQSIARMYLNDREGCCVISGKMHALGVWSANDDDSGGIVLATDQEVHQQYQGICGPGDNGCIITNVLDWMRTRGLTASGKTYKIDGYVAVDWRDQTMVKVAQYLFGATTIGIALPADWTNQAVWDVTDSRIVGGHDVTPVDYDERGVYVSSWGRMYLITWRAFTSTRWLVEYYALLAPLWYGNDKMAPCGVDKAALITDLQKINQGILPPLPEPAPPDPIPTPPVPPSPPPVPSLKELVDAIFEALKKQYASNGLMLWALGVVQKAIDSLLSTPHTLDSLPVFGDNMGLVANHLTKENVMLDSNLEKCNMYANDLASKLPMGTPNEAEATGLLSVIMAIINALRAGDMNAALLAIIELLKLFTGTDAAISRQQMTASAIDWKSILEIIFTKILPLILGL